jgi:hypothetical protein
MVTRSMQMQAPACTSYYSRDGRKLCCIDWDIWNLLDVTQAHVERNNASLNEFGFHLELVLKILTPVTSSQH